MAGGNSRPAFGVYNHFVGFNGPRSKPDHYMASSFDHTPFHQLLNGISRDIKGLTLCGGGGLGGRGALSIGLRQKTSVQDQQDSREAD